MRGRSVSATREASTFLTHTFGRGLEDTAYVVERYRTSIEGEIRRAPVPRGQSAPKQKTLSLAAVRKLRPERNEIVICTCANIARSGVQYWGDLATGIFGEARRKLR